MGAQRVHAVDVVEASDQENIYQVCSAPAKREVINLDAVGSVLPFIDWCLHMNGVALDLHQTTIT